MPWHNHARCDWVAVTVRSDPHHAVDAKEQQPCGLFRVSTLFLVCIQWTAMSNTARPEPKTPSERLHAIFETEWQWSLENNPTWASQLGDLRYNDRWPDVSLEAIESRHAHRQEVLERLDRIDRAALRTPTRSTTVCSARSMRSTSRRIPTAGISCR